MDKETFDLIYMELNDSNITTLAEKYGVTEETLQAVLNLKLVRQNKRLYRDVKKNPGHILRRWKEGASLLTISSETGVSPALTALYLMREIGFTKKESRMYLRDPARIRNNSRLRQEVSEAVEKDFLYSPQAHKLQMERAKLGEEILGEWLAGNGVVFIEKNNTNKNPDFLFENPFVYKGRETYWADSKAIFADEKEHKRYISKQFSSYIELFGPGIVVYWYGFVDSILFLQPEIVVMDCKSISNPKIEKLFEKIR
jgi:hypothetical protein